jgi:hypothetical protein
MLLSVAAKKRHETLVLDRDGLAETKIQALPNGKYGRASKDGQVV